MFDLSNTYLSYIAFLPIFTVFIGMLFFKKSAVISGLLGIVVTVLMSIFIGFDWQISHIFNILLSSFYLTVSVALVILPGLIFNALVRKQGLTHSLVHWLKVLPLSKEAKTLLVLFGLAPAVESLTGFGISIFLTLPILYSLYPIQKTVQLGMISIHIMPWGTLGLATLMGAMLIDRHPLELGILTSLTSAFIFPYLGIVSACLISKNYKHIFLGFILGSLLSLNLIIFNRFVNVEVAGILSGFCVCGIGLYFLKNENIQLRQGLTLFFPYVLLLGLVFVQRIIPGFYENLSQIWILKAEGVSFHPLTSPGLLLIFVTFLLFLHKPSYRINIKEVFQKSQKTILGIGLFLLLSQILVQTGMLEALVIQVSQILDQTQTVMVSPLLGILSGLTTGSNVGGNALLIDAQYQLGIESGGGEKLAILLAALQNSGAGHAVFSSMPMILLFLGILQNESDEDIPAEHEVLRFTLRVLMGVIVLLPLTGYILMSFF